MIVRQMRDDVFQGFSNAELLLLLDATNATVFMAGDRISAGCFVLGSAEHAMKLDKLDGKWGVDAEAFLEKLRSLTDLQAFELLIRLDCAWRNHERVEDDDQWIATAFEQPTVFTSDRANSNLNSPKGLDPLVGSGRFLVEAAGRNERRRESD